MNQYVTGEVIKEDGKIHIASQEYSVLIAEPEEYKALYESDKSLLKEFEQSGGKHYY